MHVCRQSGTEGRHYEVNLPKEKDRLPGDHVCPSSPEGRMFSGVGTAIKPGKEPICMARKPFKGSVAANVLLWGTGGLNIEVCRVSRDAGDVPGWHKSGANGANGFNGTSTFRTREMTPEEIQARCGDVGRWPSNLILDEESGAELAAQCKDTNRFFYCPKPSKREKDAGLDEFAEKAWVQWQTANGTSKKASSLSEGRNTKRKNIHPTIKPVSLMAYLCKLVTPRGGVILDHLAGSATTGVGALTAEGFNFKFIGFEKNPEYHEIGLARLLHAERQTAQVSSSGQLDGSNVRPDSRHSTNGGGTVPTIRRKNRTHR
jgi:site-specific DNA-methyltransferase (adenine-specific)